MLHNVPSWAFYMNIWELISTIAYTLTFALVEAFLILVLVVMLGWIVPKRWIEEKYVPLISLFLIEAAIVAMLLQYFTQNQLPETRLLIGAVPLIGISAIPVLVIPKVRDGLQRIASRLLLLTYLYIAVDIVSALIVLFRNF